MIKKPLFHTVKFIRYQSHSIQSINPTTSSVIRKCEYFSSDQIQQLIQNSFHAYEELAQGDHYSHKRIEERANWIKQLGQVLLQNKDSYAETITLEMGKPIIGAVQEVEKCASLCDYFAKEGPKMLHPIEHGHDAKIVFDPLGPILELAPFNFPFWQVIRFAVPAILAGNPIILRHSHSVPQCAIIIEEAFRRAFPEDKKYVFQNAFLDNSSVADVIADKRIRGVTFTGSTETGKIIAGLAAKNLKKHVLELGGSDPFIVLKDADLQLAVKNAITARTLNNGQSCIAAKRFIVDKHVVKEFTSELVKGMKNLTIGDPMQQSVQIGPLARQDLRDKLHEQVQQAVKQGAKVECGGDIPKLTGHLEKGYFYQPTVLSNVQKGNLASYEEFFGPVASVISVENEQEAIAIANSTPYGLGGSVYTKDLKKGEQICRALECGMAFVNGIVRSSPNLPFGGVKASGYGRECSVEGLREWTNIKTICISK